LRTIGSEKIATVLSTALQELGFDRIYLKNKHFDGESPNGSLPDGWLAGEGSTEIEILENGLKFKVDIESGQKTGFFLDQRDNRELIGKLTKDKKVLNAFAYSGGFSVYALANGAKEVHSVDISKSAVALADANVALNFGETKNHKSVAEDCFSYLKTMDSDYDVIILDPPAFAKSMRARDRAARGYKEINMTALSNIKSGGILATFSCSQVVDRDLFRKIVFSAAADSGRNVRILYQLTQPEDHPINIYHPEGEYLKGLILYVE
jgi:23S rRNA (cytosine1962-C5)-methyltransferase